MQKSILTLSGIGLLLATLTPTTVAAEAKKNLPLSRQRKLLPCRPATHHDLRRHLLRLPQPIHDLPPSHGTPRAKASCAPAGTLCASDMFAGHKGLHGVLNPSVVVRKLSPGKNFAG